MVLCTEELREHVDRGCPMVLGGPIGNIMAAKAVAFAEARRPEFATYAQAIVDNARALAEGLLRRGATLVTGGTDNHLVLIDVTSYGITGRQAEDALLAANIVTNRNAVPADPNGAWFTSGVRVGTPAHDPRVGRGRDGRDRRPDPHGAAGHQPRYDARRRPEQGQVRAGGRGGRTGQRPHPRPAGADPPYPSVDLT